jgi:spore germination protein KB
LSEKKVQISPGQLIILIATTVLTTVDIFVPAFVAQEAKNDSWISTVLSGIVSFLFVWVQLKLYSRYKGSTLIEICRKAAGKLFGTIIGLLYTLYFTLISIYVSAEMGQSIKTAFMPLTPTWAFITVSILISAYAVGRDIEVIARINEIVFPFGIAALLILFFVNIGELDLKFFLPVLKDGFKPPLRGGLVILGWMGEIVLVLQLLPYISKQEKINKSVLLGNLVVAVGILLGTMVYALFGPLTELFLIPSLEFARFASLGKYIQNFDLIVMAIWATGIYIKLMIFYFVATFSLAQLCNVNNYKTLVLPAGLLIGSLVISSEVKIVEVLHFLHYIFPLYSVTMTFVIPLILLVLSFLNKKE